MVEIAIEAQVADAAAVVAAGGGLQAVNQLQSPVFGGARKRAGQTLVGFAAETSDLLANAQAKRARKGVPLLVGNIGPDTFGQDDNALLLVDEAGTRELPRDSKLALARQLVVEIAQRLGTGTCS